MEGTIDIERLERTIAPGNPLRPKECLLARNSTLSDMVASRLALEWSPEQISGWLRVS